MRVLKPFALLLLAGLNIVSAANTFYAGIESYIEETKTADTAGELSTFKTIIDQEPFAAIKALLTTDYAAGDKKALFAPSNAAFEALLAAVAANDESVALTDLLSTEGLKDLVSTVLKYHWVPAYVDEANHKNFTNNDTADTGLPAALGAKLIMGLNADGNLIVKNGLSNQISTTVKQENAKVITIDGQPLADSASHQGHLHVVDSVLLPISADTVYNLAAFNAEANRPVDNTFHLVEKLLSVDSSALKDAKAAIYTPKLRGAIFLPNDAAVTQFIATLAVQLPTTGLTAAKLLKNADLIAAILGQHVIFDTVLDGTVRSYKTGFDGAGVDIKVLSEDGFGFPTSVQVGERTAGVLGKYGESVNGLVARLVRNCKGCGYVYYISTVLYTDSVIDAAKARASPPKDGAWKNQAPAAAGVVDTVAIVVDAVPEIKSLFEGTKAFSVFMPNDAAFTNLAKELGVEVTDLKKKLTGSVETMRKMLGSYIVEADKYANNDNPADCTDDCEMIIDQEYETLAGTWLKQTSTGFKIADTIADLAKRRSLLAASGNIEGCQTFFDGKKLCYVDTAPLTATQEESVRTLLSGGSPPPPPPPPPPDAASVAAPTLLLLATLMATLIGL